MKEFDRKYISEKALEKYDDACFAVLMEGYAAKLGEEYIEENERLRADESFEFPAGLDEKCLKAIDKTFARKRRSKTAAQVKNVARKAVLAAAAFLLVIGLSSTVLYHTVEAFRLKVVDYAIEFLDIGDGSIVSIKSNEQPENMEVFPSWLPDGYELVEDYAVGDVRTLKFSDGMETFRFTITKTGSVTIDTENVDELYETKVNGFESIITMKENEIACYWFDYDKERAYILSACNVSSEILLKIAESCYE